MSLTPLIPQPGSQLAVLDVLLKRLATKFLLDLDCVELVVAVLSELLLRCTTSGLEWLMYSGGRPSGEYDRRWLLLASIRSFG